MNTYYSITKFLTDISDAIDTKSVKILFAVKDSRAKPDTYGQLSFKPFCLIDDSGKKYYNDDIRSSLNVEGTIVISFKPKPKYRTINKHTAFNILNADLELKRFEAKDGNSIGYYSYNIAKYPDANGKLQEKYNELNTVADEETEDLF